MKKLLIAVLVISFAFSLSCGNDKLTSKQMKVFQASNQSGLTDNTTIKNIAIGGAGSGTVKSVALSKCKTIADLAGTGYTLSKITGIGYQVDFAQSVPNSNPYVVITVDGKKGLVDYKGNIVVPIIYNEILNCFHGIVADEYEYSFDLKEKHPHQGHGLEHSSYYWDKTTERMYELYYDYAPSDWPEKPNNFIYPVQSAVFYGDNNQGHDYFAPKVLVGRYGFVRNGKLMIPLQYSAVHYFSDGLAAVKKDGLWGYVNEFGKVVIPFQYDDVYEANMDLTEIVHNEEIPYNFSNGYAAVCKGGKWGYIDKLGKEITPFLYTKTLMPYQGKAWARNEAGNWTILDLKASL